MVFFAFANLVALFFSTSFIVAHFSNLWCKGTSKAAIQTNASNIKIGEWWVILSKNGCSNRLRNSKTSNKAITPKNEISLVLVIKLRLRKRNMIIKEIRPIAINAYWIFCFRSISEFVFSDANSSCRNCSLNSSVSIDLFFHDWKRYLLFQS
mgnify:CR=1 FL=1